MKNFLLTLVLIFSLGTPALAHDVADVVDQALPSTVVIVAEIPQVDGKIKISMGSGVIITSDGSILTCAHLINSASKISIILVTGEHYLAKPLFVNQESDIALVKINKTGLPHAIIGDPNKLRVGEEVIAIGSPMGLVFTVTRGIVSQLRIQDDNNLIIQSDAAINHGNSGGPLINMQGEVVGIVDNLVSKNGESIGLGFAIPIDVALKSVLE